MPSESDSPKKNENRVLSESYRPSSNFYYSDVILRSYLKDTLSADSLEYMDPVLSSLGKKAALEMDALSLTADKHGPELVNRNWLGEDVQEIRFHPAYGQLLNIAVESEMFRVKWEPELRNRFSDHRNAMGFASGLIYAMSESGVYCPLCMTDGVALLIDKWCSEEDKARLMPHIYTDKAGDLFTGAMFLTEKAGGSDVGANLVSAVKTGPQMYRLNGEKWFCSNANAELIFALCRTDPAKTGTSGLSIFLVEQPLPGGGKNPMKILRLKDKLGVRSMASAEILLTDTVGKRVGEEFEGFRIMSDMINLSRLYNSVAAVGGGRRALAEAWQFLHHRISFGKFAVEHPLIRDKFFELGSLHVANFYLCWRAISALDKAENGDSRESALLRLLTPMVKKWTAETAVYLVRESMELMGGMGYIEDGVLPKIMRDVMVLPIWEGAGNIMILDMLRASRKSEGLQVMMDDIYIQAQSYPEYGRAMKQELDGLAEGFQALVAMPIELQQYHAKYLFDALCRLFRMAVMLDALTDHNQAWILPAVRFLAEKTQDTGKPSRELPGLKEVSQLIGWQV
jgi:alkylation response protein AidB-like acyl-CoA dehydrogenase